MSSGLQSRYGSWAVVTGASAGIGRALAVELASGGLNVVLVARREDRLTALSSQLASAHGVSCRVVALDLIAADAIDRLTSATADLDVGLVAHAAGVGVGGPHFDARVERHHRMLALNCGAALDLLSAYLPAMKARGRGGFVLFGSVVGFTGVPWAAHYSATKAWIHSLGEALQVELRGTGVDVSVVAPGPTTS
ncbi:MAG: SDR family NAD(P)-dependent oxidoreductase, partial [Myxococcota bacterium]